MTMKFIFRDNIPTGKQPVLISGIESLNNGRDEYLIVEKEDGIVSYYEMRAEHYCSPFKEALIADGILAAGHENAFYLFDTIQNKSLLVLKIHGYFGHIYFDNDLFHVSGCKELYCIDKTGAILWHKGSLAIDGVIIENFTGDKIYASAQLDPPDGWEDFILNRQTGEKIE